MPPDIQALDRDALEGRLAYAESRLTSLLPLPELFEMEEPSPDTEARLRPVLDELYDGKSEEAPYDLECRGVVCRFENYDDTFDWNTATEGRLDLLGMISAVSVTPSIRFMRLEEPGRAAGLQWSFGLISRLMTASAVTDCKARHPAPGFVDLALQFDAQSRRVSVQASGPLSNQEGGICIRRVLEELIAQKPVPLDVTSVFDEPFLVVIP